MQLDGDVLEFVSNERHGIVGRQWNAVRSEVPGRGNVLGNVAETSINQFQAIVARSEWGGIGCIPPDANTN